MSMPQLLVSTASRNKRSTNQIPGNQHLVEQVESGPSSRATVAGPVGPAASGSGSGSSAGAGHGCCQEPTVPGEKGK